jgi:single-strand selective monofunctional uracil DNA glycosylase
MDDRLGSFWRWSARRFEPLAREIGRATGWLVVNPGRYGEPWHARFRRSYPPRARPLLFCGLNPGPYGMAQTGVPFTDLKRLQADLPTLAAELEASGAALERPGLAPPELRPFLTRTFESSSVRVYRFLALLRGSAEAAFRDVVFVNPCPLLFIDREVGANRTPADLPRALRQRTARGRAASLIETFDAARVDVVSRAVDLLEPRGAVLLGRDVAAILGETLRARLGARAVVEWEHPARAVPDRWARGLASTLRRRGLDGGG